MFGYVRPSDGHLTAEDKQRFQAAYCGLCRSLGRRYGLAARMILNYDLAFLAMLLSREPECPTAHCRCPAHPIRGCDALEPQPAFDAAADLSVILTWWQLTDGVADHGFFRVRASFQIYGDLQAVNISFIPDIGNLTQIDHRMLVGRIDSRMIEFNEKIQFEAIKRPMLYRSPMASRILCRTNSSS